MLSMTSLISWRKKGLLSCFVCGDYNICHKEIDIHNPVANKDTSGFKPEERAWMTKFFDSGFVDTFRVFNPQAHEYSWWSLRANSRANNKGWRIDYISASKKPLERTCLTQPCTSRPNTLTTAPVYLKLKTSKLSRLCYSSLSSDWDERPGERLISS